MYLPTAILEKRQFGYGYGYGGGGRGYGTSPWNSYGRWILLGGVILLAAFVCCLYSCMRSRKRVNHGQKPLPYTAWMVPNSQYPQQSGAYNGGDNTNNYGSSGYGYNQSYPMQSTNSGTAAPGQGDYVDYTQQYQPPPGPPPSTAYPTMPTAAKKN